MMRSTFRDYGRKEVKPGDYKQALWEQNQNCYNSLNTMETEAISMQSLPSQMKSGVSLQKFAANVDILEAMMHSRKLVTTLSVSRDFAEGQKKYAELGRVLIDKVWIEKTEDLGMV